MDARRSAWILALAGLAPFAALSAGLVLLGENHPAQGVAADAMRTYAAVILSFLGGVRWGFALRRDNPAGGELALAVLPSIAGWLSLFLPLPLSFAALLLSFCAMGAWDSFAIHAGLGPRWFASLRIALTVLVAACLALALAAVV